MIVSAHIEALVKDMVIEMITMIMTETIEEAITEENVIPVASAIFSVVVADNKKALVLKASAFCYSLNYSFHQSALKFYRYQDRYQARR